MAVLPVISLATVVVASGWSPSISAAQTAATPPIASRRLIRSTGISLVSTLSSVTVAEQSHFVYHKSMNVVHDPDAAVSEIASAIGEPARARMLYCLVDGRARTSTELAAVAEITPSTASVHLQRLKMQHLVKVLAQGKHRYYSLDGANVAAALEALSVLAGGSRSTFVPNTPNPLRAARTCYDHIAGTLGVSLHDRFQKLGWLSAGVTDNATDNVTDNACDLTPKGTKSFESLGVDVATTRTLRRRFAYSCVDWSERRPHLGGALAAALLNVSLKRKWILQDLDSRALSVTSLGKREMLTRFGLQL
jgi:DNA-binding transcriptional ArsR family regulator